MEAGGLLADRENIGEPYPLDGFYRCAGGRSAKGAALHWLNFFNGKAEIRPPERANKIFGALDRETGCAIGIGIGNKIIKQQVVCPEDSYRMSRTCQNALRPVSQQMSVHPCERNPRYDLDEGRGLRALKFLVVIRDVPNGIRVENEKHTVTGNYLNFPGQDPAVSLGEA